MQLVHWPGTEVRNVGELASSCPGFIITSLFTPAMFLTNLVSGCELGSRSDFYVCVVPNPHVLIRLTNRLLQQRRPLIECGCNSNKECFLIKTQFAIHLVMENTATVKGWPWQLTRKIFYCFSRDSHSPTRHRSQRQLAPKKWVKICAILCALKNHVTLCGAIQITS
jgi:hypothetical protein